MRSAPAFYGIHTIRFELRHPPGTVATPRRCGLNFAACAPLDVGLSNMERASSNMRDEFSKDVILRVAKRAAFRCSHPQCAAATVGPSDESSGAVANVGVAAHICAASPGGPRYDRSMTTEQRSSIDNAIWVPAALIASPAAVACRHWRVSIITVTICILAEIAVDPQPRAIREIATVRSCTDSTPIPPNCSGAQPPTPLIGIAGRPLGARLPVLARHTRKARRRSPALP